MSHDLQERRVLDYLHAYRTTGRPPVPVPQQPTDAQQRAALGLPPLFVPFSEAESGTVALPGLNGTTPGPISTTSSASSGSLEVQVFAAMKTQEYGSEAHFYSIVAQPEYSKYSFEV